MGYDEDYRNSAAWFGAAPAQVLVDHLALLDRERPVLDVGAGQGRHALFLARAGFRVHAIDPSAVAVETIAHDAAREELDVTVAKTGFDEFDAGAECFGAVVVCGLLPDLRRAEIEALVCRVDTWTEDGSHLVLTGFTTEDPGFARYRDGGREVEEGTFQLPGGARRTFLRPGELPGLFPTFRIVHHREYLGPEHRHGDGPPERHGVTEAVLVR